MAAEFRGRYSGDGWTNGLKGADMQPALWTIAVLGLVAGLAAGDDSSAVVSFREASGKVVIAIDQQEVAEYIYADPAIARPHFARLKTRGGIQASRNQPPIEGQDAVDHPLFHPGAWMAFGDINGSDSWRLKSRVRHEGFVVKPTGGNGEGAFAVRSSYLSPAPNETVVANEIARFRVCPIPYGYLLLWDATIQSDSGFTFGEQDEMGVGVRVATPLAVKNGGRMADSEGRRNEKEIWGNTANWCDYGGKSNGHSLGMTLLANPANERPTWFHARDYGFMAANPFGPRRGPKEPPRKIAFAPNQPFRWRGALFVHQDLPEGPAALDAAFRNYVELAKE